MIQMKNLSFQYKNASQPTLKKISFALETGSVMAVVGPSGGGKSTLLRVIAGLEEPSEGNIVVDDQIVFGEGIYVKPERRGIGMVFQDYALFPHMTVKSNILYGISHLKKSNQEKRLSEVIELVALEGYEKRYPHELSGGQQQRVALARTLATQPGLLLLDEPFSNLDAQLLMQVREHLFRIIRETGITTVMVTHNLEDAVAHADKIIEISDAQLHNVEICS